MENLNSLIHAEDYMIAYLGDYSNDLLGFASILVVILLTYFITLRFPAISKILLVALAIRVSLMLAGHYLVMLPESDGDSEDFETGAWMLAQGGVFYVWNYITLPNPHAFIWVIALVYSLIDRSILMIQSISIFFGIGCVILGWLTAKKLWDDRTAKKVAWMITLFPSLVLYSVLVMREVYIVFFILLSIYGVVSWAKNYSFKSILLAMIGFIGGAFFHGAILVGAITFIVIVGISSLVRFYKSIINYRINLKVLTFILFFLTSSALYLSNIIDVSYLGRFEEAANISNLMYLTELNTRGSASWPKWLIISSPYEIFYKVPIRGIYFVLAPFPWDVSKAKHLIPLFDAILYIYFIYLILQNRKVIWRDPALRAILIILIAYILVFGIGVGNFGTGLRHRSKFVVMFILLAAPSLKKFIFLKKNLGS